MSIRPFLVAYFRVPSLTILLPRREEERKKKKKSAGACARHAGAFLSGKSAQAYRMQAEFPGQEKHPDPQYGSVFIRQSAVDCRNRQEIYMALRNHDTDAAVNAAKARLAQEGDTTSQPEVVGGVVIVRSAAARFSDAEEITEQNKGSESCPLGRFRVGTCFGADRSGVGLAPVGPSQFPAAADISRKRMKLVDKDYQDPIPGSADPPATAPGSVPEASAGTLTKVLVGGMQIEVPVTVTEVGDAVIVSSSKFSGLSPGIPFSLLLPTGRLDLEVTKSSPEGACPWTAICSRQVQDSMVEDFPEEEEEEATEAVEDQSVL